MLMAFRFLLVTQSKCTRNTVVYKFEEPHVGHRFKMCVIETFAMAMHPGSITS